MVGRIEPIALYLQVVGSVNIGRWIDWADEMKGKRDAYLMNLRLANCGVLSGYG